MPSSIARAEAAASALPIAVIGAGPVGLAAASHLAVRGLPFVVYEAGDEPGAAIREWGHVTFFSPWRFNVDDAARSLLEPTGWRSPDPDLDPPGHDLVDKYLAPLAAHPRIAPHIRYGAEVVAVTREGIDRVPSDREGRPFEVTTRERDGMETRLLARAIIDASGTWRSPNPAGATGRPAVGELANRNRIRYGIPDVYDRERARYANRTVAVIGSGHSAMDSILGLARLRSEHPGTSVLWLMRSASTEKVFGGLTDDQLGSRGRLGERARAVVDGKEATVVAPFRVRAFAAVENGVDIVGEAAHGEAHLTVQEVIVATGFRPDFAASSEIRLDLHPWLECPRALGPLVDPNEHNCGTVPPHGARELAHAEKDFYIVGMKSYGRAPTFLMMTGYEQVRSVVAALAGDWNAALETRLVLPETGACEAPAYAETSCLTAGVPASGRC